MADNKNDKLEYPNIMKTQNNLNDLRNNLSYQSHGRNNLRNLPNSQSFYFSEKSRTYPLINDNVNKMNTNNFGISNFNISNIANFNGLNNFNLGANPCIYINNNINYNMINNRPQYKNFLIYYV